MFRKGPQLTGINLKPTGTFKCWFVLKYPNKTIFVVRHYTKVICKISSSIFRAGSGTIKPINFYISLTKIGQNILNKSKYWSDVKFLSIRTTRILYEYVWWSHSSPRCSAMPPQDTDITIISTNWNNIGVTKRQGRCRSSTLLLSLSKKRRMVTVEMMGVMMSGRRGCEYRSAIRRLLVWRSRIPEWLQDARRRRISGHWCHHSGHDEGMWWWNCIAVLLVMGKWWRHRCLVPPHRLLAPLVVGVVPVVHVLLVTDGYLLTLVARQFNVTPHLARDCRFVTALA